MSSLDHTYAVILAGGGGTRLWPKSRTKTPKQFLKLTGEKTMIELTADRINALIPWERMIVVTNTRYEKEVRELLPKIPKTNIIAEPEKKDTALAMLTGSIYAKLLDPEAVIINQASDHTVENQTEFLSVMRAAAQAAQSSDRLVTVGIAPSYPATGFGYIKIGEDIDKIGKHSVFAVDSFTEKPNETTAKAFISTGKYFWNANMYVWSAESILAAFAAHFPSMSKKVAPLLKTSPKTFHTKLAQVYADADAISIDYAISEKADNLVLIPGDFGWDDIGEWQVVYEHGSKNLSGNVIIGNEDGSPKHVLAISSHNNLVHLDRRLVALIGINDCIVVDTDEILMIAPRSKSQEVKKLVTRLKEEKKNEYL